MNWIDNYIADARPAMERISRRCDHFSVRVLDHLEGIRRGVEDDKAREAQFRRWPKSKVADANGLADLHFEVPLGKSVRLISMAGSGLTAGAGVGCAVYAGDADNEANLLHVFGGYALRFSGTFPDGMYVGAGEDIIVRFIGQGAAGQRVTANLNIALLNSHPVNARNAGQQFDPPGLSGQETEETERHFTDTTTEPLTEGEYVR